MPLPEPQYKAIMNLGNIGKSVNEMNRQAIILKTQRTQTFDILNRLRTLIRKLLTSYSGNKATLDQVYNDIMTATTTAGDTQRRLLEQLANELRESLAETRTEQQFTQLKADVETLISEMENVSRPGPGAGAGAGAGDTSSGAGAGAGAGDTSSGAGAGDGAGVSRGDKSQYIGANDRPRMNTYQVSPELKEKYPDIGRGGRSKKKRSKRGGYSWRTPSPNKSRKKTPTYKKTIKKTRTRQN